MTDRCVIFDLDGTLTDSAPGVKESFVKAVNAVLPGATVDIASVVIGPPLPKMFEAAYPNATAEQVKALVTAFRADYTVNGWNKTDLFGGVERALTTLASRGVQMFVVTNKPLGMSRKILRYFKLDGFFSEIRSLDSVNPPYANKSEMLKALIRDHHLKPEQCVLIGDTRGDADAAAAAQMPFIWVSFGYGKRSEIPETAKLMDSFDELTGLCL